MALDENYQSLLNKALYPSHIIITNALLIIITGFHIRVVNVTIIIFNSLFMPSSVCLEY